jgi:hypothetical protein
MTYSGLAPQVGCAVLSTPVRCIRTHDLRPFHHRDPEQRSSSRAVLWAWRDEQKKKKTLAMKGCSLLLFSGHDVAHLDPGISQPAYRYASGLPILRVQSSILIFISKKYYIVIIFMVFVQLFL